jgi:hypothetical protein
MKHLRRFNEGYTQQDLDELKDFCEMYLAYLIDKGFIIDICEEDMTYYSNVGLVSISDQNLIYQVIIFEKEKPEDLHSDEWDFSVDKGFSWNEIKDQYIPFLQMLSKSYKMNKITYYKEWVDVKVIYRKQLWDEVVKTYNLSDFISGKFNNELSTMDIVEINVGVKL